MGAAVTVNDVVAVWLRLPLTAVIVNEYVPAAVVELVLMVMVVEPPPITEVGLKLALAPVGNPATLNVTALLNPFSAVMFTLTPVLLPATTVSLAWAATVKSGAAAVCTMAMALIFGLLTTGTSVNVICPPLTVTG